MTKRPEILAPAGSPDALRAAVADGADAVYLGLQDFNARGNAINFTTEELAHYVPFAHEGGTRVYLTLNTIVKMEEMKPIMESLSRLVDCGLDGVILQDIGLGRMMAKYFPSLRRHASTQMAIHNLEGVQFCVDEGFERVVLARELTLQELQEIRTAFPADVIELEVFCHGAMCYTYSGMCFFSGSVGGRSGNRGECAYTCRKGYRIHNERRFPMAPEPDSYRNYLFSMKDMNTLDVLPELVETGIDSLKIEGRRKGPAYVSASVKAYKDRLSGMKVNPEAKDLRLAFGRAYTRAFYERGQFGDSPIDVTTTGTQGVHIGTIDDEGAFTLLERGIQRYDGVRIVKPNREEEAGSFRDFKVERGDRMKPEKGVRIFLEETYPEGSKVMWVRSQEVERRYKPEKGRPAAQGEKDARVKMVVCDGDGSVDVRYVTPYGSVARTLEYEASTSGKQIPLKKMLYRFGDSAFLEGGYEGPEAVDGFVPASQLKRLRREMLAELTETGGKGREKVVTAMIAEATERPMTAVRSVRKGKYIVRVDQVDLLEQVIPMARERSWDIDFLVRATLSTPDWKKAQSLLNDFDGGVRLALPLVLRRWDLRLMRRRLEDLGRFDVVLANPGQVPMMRPYAEGGVRLHADFSVYHINTWACEALRDMGIDGRLTLSLEDDKQNMEKLLEAVEPEGFEVIAYTDTPLFIAEACSLAALYGGCPGAKVCEHETLDISNEHGDRFQVRHDRCRSTVIGEKALSWSGSLDWFMARGVEHFRADFTVRPYKAADVDCVMRSLEADQFIAKTHSENLERTLL